jgi:SAM-dependent methyltransferase
MRSSEAPYPPMDLASRVFSAVGWEGDPYRAYDALGAQTKQVILELLPDDWSFEGRRILDFGSGAGRTLRHFLAEAEQGEFWGADIDRPSIEWLQQNLHPPINAWHHTEGPLLGLEHGSFDLIYAVSVFTHLTDNWSSWLLELHRLLKPDGLFVVSYAGRWTSQWVASEPWDENRIGRNVLHHAAPWDVGGPIALTSDWWFEEHFGRAFDIVATKPQFQHMTWALLRKRDVDLTTADLEAPGDDPREYLALRHNLAQVQREVEEAQARAAQAQQDAVLEYEHSASWRVTKPLRLATRAIRERRNGQQDG